MALIYNGKNIPTTAKNIKYNGVSLDRVYYGSTLVWEYKLPVVTIANPKIGNITGMEFYNHNDGAWIHWPDEHSGFTDDGAGVWTDVEYMSYGTLKISGYLSGIDFTGYNKVTIKVDTETGSTSYSATITTSNFSIGSYAIEQGSDSHPTHTFVFTNLPTNLGTKPVYFDIRIYGNTDNKTDRRFWLHFDSIKLELV